MEKKEFDWKKFIVNIDQYVSAVLFIVIMVLLFLQVVTRYVFRHSFTWTEELSVLLFVWMTYMGVSSAVTYRKNLRIDALLDVVPFRVKKLLLIISKAITYWLIPAILVISSAKLVYDIYRLWHEDEKRLGVSRPTIDLDSLEAEYKAHMAEQHKKEVQ